jgi:hypothetical protein
MWIHHCAPLGFANCSVDPLLERIEAVLNPPPFNPIVGECLRLGSFDNGSPRAAVTRLAAICSQLTRSSAVSNFLTNAALC